MFSYMTYLPVSDYCSDSVSEPVPNLSSIAESILHNGFGRHCRGGRGAPAP